MGFLTSIEVVCSITPCEGFTFLEGENKISFSINGITNIHLEFDLSRDIDVEKMHFSVDCNEFTYVIAI